MMDVDAAKAFFRVSPFMVDLGIEPRASRHEQHTGQVHAFAMATMAVTAAKEPA
jgi:hypothetical protein